MSSDSQLFCSYDLTQVLNANNAHIQKTVDNISREQFLASNDNSLIEHVMTQLEVEPLTLYEDRMEMEQEESKVDVSGDRLRNPFQDPGPIYISSIRITVSIPYSGDKELWWCQPNHFRMTWPMARVCSPVADGVGYLNIVIERPADANKNEFKESLDRTLESIRNYLNTQREQIDQYNHALPNKIRESIARRQKYLEQHDAVRKVLDIPLKQRYGAPSVEPIPVKRKTVRPLPPAPSAPSEPGIADDAYEHILKVIRHEGRTFETTPATFAKHDEEELRNIILAHLNGHYEGDATGEAFRNSGKTDIRIEFDNRAAFVGECKVWHGQKQLVEALDQLFGYLTWRDCKAAMVIFNKDTAGFTGIQEKVPETLTGHSNYIKTINVNRQGEWRFQFRSKADPDRHITVHIFLFDLYVKGKAL